MLMMFMLLLKLLVKSRLLVFKFLGSQELGIDRFLIAWGGEGSVTTPTFFKQQLYKNIK